MTLQQLDSPEPTLIEEEKEIPMRDEFKNVVKIHRPKDGIQGGGPMIVLNFGGGWVSGDKDSMTPTARALVRLFKAVVISISYRLAHKHKFPVGQQEAYDSVKWLGQHASEIHADPSKGFIVGGISAGGTNSAVSTRLSIEENISPKITGQWLCVPAIMNEEHVPAKYKKHFLSHEHNKEAPILSDAALKALAKHTQWGSNSPLRFPILSKVPVKNLPPTFIQADGLDPIRDDALIYDEILKEAGVKTRCHFYPGAPHAHFAFMPGLEITNRALTDIAVGFGWLLGRELGAEEGLQAFAPPA
ncbi:alpha/beta-hydrolase [Teratosphaeria nubilosa]|uniref:Alpha/beta-hydrolase n=1 Tax=Teratosphaeria nubilosa TaxID=161662 RepID=A0A6G1L0W1_9PEZI|nr:alpha/beta-hydrolase [Teratosphaeria nubilosa]